MKKQDCCSVGVNRTGGGGGGGVGGLVLLMLERI